MTQAPLALAPELITELSLKVTETHAYIVEVGTEEKVRNQGVCEEFKFTIQGVEFQQNFFLMELGGTELVLGLDWLASLRNIEANFRNLCFKWSDGGQKHVIESDPSL